ncbi:glutamyl-tRNA subunit a [Phlyctema vagabunda]|uniref:Glutamyl-tRNA subunit a n=1 Tax=Phlyctema vagabunda TaxID=108571 RepID=A0ABR4PG56_9HELO
MTTLPIGSHGYYLFPKPITQIITIDSDGDTEAGAIAGDTITKRKEPVPVTLIHIAELGDTHQHAISLEDLNQRLKDMMKFDDVLDQVFTKSVIILLGSHDTLSPRLANSSSSQISISFAKSDVEIPSAPYFLVGHNIHQAFKLYPDPNVAFICGVVPSEDGTRSYRKITTDLIPVPSRWYFPPTSSEKPLSGKRVAIKDIFDVHGLKTTAGSKEREVLYPELDSTAPAIQILIDQGAVIVGKTKTVCFASGAGPNDWVDYQCPINPRGDGNLDPDCSSTGSGVAIAAYDWLDYSIGSDSLGSMVGPAAVNGIFGLRPTQGALAIDGGILVSKYFDTPGHFSRSLPDFAELTEAWLPKGVDESLKITKLLYLEGLLDSYGKPEREILESFFCDFEKAANVKREPIDFGKSYDVSSFDKLATVKWDDYLSDTLAHIQLYDSRWNNQKFEDDFREAFGRDPALEPLVRFKRNLARSISEEKYNTECDKMHLFRRWLHEVVFVEGTVLLLPITHVEPALVKQPGNNVPAKDPLDWQGFGLKSTAISVLGGLPCISFPVGQTKYHSHILNEEVFRPVNLMLLGPPGSDVQLIELLQDIFSKSGRPVSVKFGATAY